ncbi:hypothetical protein U1Q18_052381 [Sarracenia purpurea var. burkii]
MSMYKHRFCLGYQPTVKDFVGEKRVELSKKYLDTLNGYFVKEGKDLSYCGFSEPWIDEGTNQKLPGLEIFFTYNLFESEEEQDAKGNCGKGKAMVEDKDWADIMIRMEDLINDQMSEMRIVDSDCLMMDQEARGDYTRIIMNATLKDVKNWFLEKCKVYDVSLESKSEP